MRNILYNLAVALLLLAGVGCMTAMDIRKAEKHMAKGQWKEADELLEKVAAAHGGSKWGQRASMLKGCAQFRRSKYVDAAGTLEMARDSYPEGEWADDCEYYLARVRFSQGDYGAAMDGFRRVLTSFGDDPDRSNWKVMALEEIEYMRKQGLLDDTARQDG